MSYPYWRQQNSNSLSGPEQVVEASGVLVEQTVGRLCRDCPEYLLGVAAQDALMDLRPRVLEALEALEEIEKRRQLTEEELSQQHAFVTLLNTKR